MTKSLGVWMLGYGALSMAWGVLLRRGMEWARWAALATTGLLAAVFASRSTASWTAVQAGQPKLVAVRIITAMGLAPLATLYVLVRAPGRARTPAHAPSA